MLSNSRKIAVIGLGYVGLPVATAFSEKNTVIAFDINKKRISELQTSIDVTGEVEPSILKNNNLIFTYDANDLKKADFFIVAVPTPIDNVNQPDLQPILKASEIIGTQLKKGDIVVYESTVYPGVTEEECGPILEKHSGLRCGVDFFLGYSPERINPGDKEHTFINNKKIVSGQTKEILEIVASVYESVVKAGVYKAPSIKVAEAAKVIENTQRDLNIAFINELAIILHKLDIDTKEVLDAARTKWNFLPFMPGLVGGHCIGVDPYYLTYKAESVNYHPEIILAGRRVNDNMGKYIAEQTIKLLLKTGANIKDAKVGILGLTFKENCPDIRNTQVVSIIKELQDYQIKMIVHDPIACAQNTKREYNLELESLTNFHNLDALIIAVTHRDYLNMQVEDFINMLNPTSPVIIDVKSMLDKNVLVSKGVKVWRL